MFREAVLVVLISLSCQVHSECIKSFRAVYNSTFKEITSKEPVGWYAITDQCNEADGGTVIRSDHGLSASDRKLCGGGVVPIGVEKFNGRLLPYGDLEWGNDLPSSGVVFDNNGFENGKHYGVMDLTTGAIHFTYEKANFTCAVCRYQNKEVSSLDELEELLVEDEEVWKKLLYFHYIAKVTSVAKYKRLMIPSDKDLKSLQDEIALTLSSIKDYEGAEAVKDLVLKSSKLNGDGKLELDFHFYVDLAYADFPDMTPYQNIHLHANYWMAVENNTECLEEHEADGNGGVTVWMPVETGSAQYKTNLTSWLVTKRSCKFDEVLDMPAWDSPRVWQIVHEPCSEYDEYVSNITNKDILGPSIELNQQHQLQQFTESPADAKTLAEVARLTSREIRAAKELTTEMHDDLRKILAALQTNGKPVVVQEPRVNFVVADWGKKSQAVNGFTMTFKETGFGQIVEPISLAVHRKASSNQVDPPPTVSLTVSDDIVGVANRIAFAAFWKPMNFWEDNIDSALSLEVDVILAGPKVGVQSNKSFIDIAYQLNEGTGASNVSCRFVPDFMAENYFLTSESSFHCIYLESARESEALCRCSTKYFTAKDGIFSGTFALKEYRSQQNDYNSGDDDLNKYLESLGDNYDDKTDE